MIRKILSLVVSIILVAASISFSISLNSNPVSAQETGCCVRDDAGNYCVNDATDEQCEGTFYTGIQCSEIQRQGNITSPCERITCLENDGTCSASKYFRQCIDNNGAWDTRELNEIPECRSGCCQILDEGEIIEQKQVTFGFQCQKDAEILDLGWNFVPGQCEVLEEQTGCCVSNFGCDMTTRLECSGVEWFGERQCSSLPDVCGDCGDYNIRKCYQGDVYEFNRCNEPNPEGPFDECDVNTQMCDPNFGNAVCKDISCDIPINFTTLNYDTFNLKSGEVAVQYKNRAGKVILETVNAFNDNYVIPLANGASACVQYQGPGETHIVYTCNRGSVEVSAISNFKGREYICEYNLDKDKVIIRKNKYEQCLSCNSLEQGVTFNDAPFKAFIDFMGWLAEAGGWQAADYEFWDYWLINDGRCNTDYSCSSLGDCTYDDESNWCVPTYPIDSAQFCDSFTTSEAGSPYNKPSEACQSVGTCRLDDTASEFSFLGTSAVCLGDIVVGSAVDWALTEGTKELLSDEEKEQLGLQDEPPTEQDIEGEGVDPADEDDLDKTERPGDRKDTKPSEGHKGTIARIKGLGRSFYNNYLKVVIFPILKLGGLIDLRYVNDAIKFYFFGIRYGPILSSVNDLTSEDWVKFVENGIRQGNDGKLYLIDDENNRVYMWDPALGDELIPVSPSVIKGLPLYFKDFGDLSPDEIRDELRGTRVPTDIGETSEKYELEINLDGILGTVDEISDRGIQIYGREPIDLNGDGRISRQEYFMYADINSNQIVEVQEAINFFYAEAGFGRGEYGTYAEAREVALNDWDIDFDKIVRFRDQGEANKYVPVNFVTGQVVRSNLLINNNRNNRVNRVSFTPLFAPALFETADTPFRYYGESEFKQYTGRETNEFLIARDWLKEWWDGGDAFLRILMNRLKNAATNIAIAVIFRSLGDEVLDAVTWLNPQKWFRVTVCNMVIGSFLGPKLAEMCESKYFIGLLSCLTTTAIQQDSYEDGVCIPKDYREVGFENCHLCNEDPFRPCTPERCVFLGTDCEYDAGVCDVTLEALQQCGNTVNKKLEVETDLSETFKVNHTETRLLLDIETSKSASCRYTEDPDTEFSKMTKFDDNDRAGLNHEVSLWTGDPLINNYKYFVQCKWACSEEDWGVQFSPIYEVSINKLPKGDQEPPVIVDSYPETAQLLEAANSLTMWVKADENLRACKYSEVNFEEFMSEAESIIGKGIDDGLADDEATEIVENLLLGFELLNPLNDMTRKSNTEFEVNLQVTPGTNYVHSIVCEDNSGHKSRPKIMLFRVSNAFDVTIIKPEHLSTTSEKIKDLKVSTGSIEADCKYSFEDKLVYPKMSLFDTTGERSHTTQLPDPLKSGKHKLFVSCVDFDNLDLSTGISDFTITPDTTPPRLLRILGGNTLLLETDEETSCTYSEQGFSEEQIPMTNSGTGSNGFFTQHTLKITSSSVYYITCEDREGNQGKYTIYP